ncbi:MAG: (2Fe-2S)-binding protein [Dehalococcoidia bacterium]
MKQRIELNVNGFSHRLEVEPWRTLRDVLREDLGLTGTKRGCDDASCGACTVLLEGKAVYSCVLLAPEAQGKSITTIEGLAHDGQLHLLQRAFIERGAIQCGFCSPGMILTAKELLDTSPQPTEEEVRQALTGVLCRCTGYAKIVEAVLAAGELMKQEAQG